MTDKRIVTNVGGFGAKVALALLTALLLAVGAAQDAPPVVKVGAIFPYTGGGAEWGPVLENTSELVVKQINDAATAVFGGPIMEVIYENDETDQGQGIERANKLVLVDEVPIIIATWSSGVAIGIAEAVTMPQEVLHIVNIATSPLITVLPADENDLLFRTIGSDDQQAIVAAQLARGELIDDVSYDTASILYVNNAYGQALAEAFKASFELRGGKVLASIGVPEEPQPTYAAQIDLALAGDPDLVFPVVYPSQGAVMLAEMRDLYGYTTWQITDSMRGQAIVDAIGADVMDGVYGTTPAADLDSDGYKRFAADYAAMFGEEPPMSFMDTTYDAVAVAGLAIAAVVAKGLEPTPYNLRDQLRPVAKGPGERIGVGDYEEAFRILAAGGEIDFSGAASELEFDDNGQVITAVEVFQFTADDIDTVRIFNSDEIPQQ